jgi:hypothetical protein
VSRVTLGNIGPGSICEADKPPIVGLRINERTNGEYNDPNGLQPPVVATAPTSQTITGPPHRVTWDIPPVTLRAGRGYDITLEWRSTSNCRWAQVATWAHNRVKVNPGPLSCSQPPYELSAAPGSDPLVWRYWHQYGDGAPDIVRPCLKVGAGAQGVNPSMPTGWIVTKGDFFDSSVTVHTPALDETPYYQCGDPSIEARGGRERYWRTNPSQPFRDDYVCYWRQWADLGTTVPDGWYYALPWRKKYKGLPRDMYVKLDTPDYNSLLARYKPQVRLDSQELYYPDQAAELTDNIGSTSDGAYANRLERHEDPTDKNRTTGLIAGLGTAVNLYGQPHTLDFLGVRYPHSQDGNLDAHPTDRLDANDDTLQQDAQRMHNLEAYGNWIYAHMSQDPTSGKVWLQYWVWYYNNPAEILNVGAHQGDWEMIQVGLDQADQPDTVTFAQHKYAERCTWDQVDKYQSALGLAPVVYAANGSHATYPRPVSGVGDAGQDATDGLVPIVPSLEVINQETDPWLAWEGTWGGTGAAGGLAEQNSPQGPAFHPQWGHPDDFSASANTCSATSSGSIRASRAGPVLHRARPRRGVAVPHLRGTRAGHVLRVHFRYGPKRRGVAGPFKLLVTATSADRRRVPAGAVRRVRTRRGTVRLRTPGPGPYLVRASTFARNGKRSRVATVRIR